MKFVLLIATAVFAVSIGPANAASPSAPLTVTVTSGSGSGTGALPGSLLPPGTWTVIDDQEMNSLPGSPWTAMNIPPPDCPGGPGCVTNSADANIQACTASGFDFSGKNCLFLGPAQYASCPYNPCGVGYMRSALTPQNQGAPLFLEMNAALIIPGAFWMDGNGSTCGQDWTSGSEPDVPEYNGQKFWTNVIYAGYGSCGSWAPGGSKRFWDINNGGENGGDCPVANCSPYIGHIFGIYWGATSPSGGMDFYFDGHHLSGVSGTPSLTSGNHLIVGTGNLGSPYNNYALAPQQWRWVRVYKCVSGC